MNDRTAYNQCLVRIFEKTGAFDKRIRAAGNKPFLSAALEKMVEGKSLDDVLDLEDGLDWMLAEVGRRINEEREERISKNE